MAQRGTLSDAGPSACPFVALELDRDRRSERPDSRHRCYAEPVPAPRTIAHQERFCLSPNFSGCPIFQDWAVRAAARSVPLPQGYEGGRRPTPEPRAVGAAGMADAAQVSMSPSESVPSADDPSLSQPAGAQPEEAWPDSMATSLPLVGAAAAAEGLAAEPIAEQQLAAFEAQPIDRDSAPSPDESHVASSATVSPPRAPMDRTPIAQPRGNEAIDTKDLDKPDDAAVPAFLVGRSSRAPRSRKTDDSGQREDVVPSWAIDGRFGAQAGGDPRSDGVFGRVLTIAAVVIILALGVAAVILIPGLLSGGPQQTVRPSVLRTASPAASGIAVVPTLTSIPLTTPSPNAEPTAVATPEPSPRVYKIKAGDTLARIARKNGITVNDILAANPQISDANDIQVGQFIVIPPPAATPAP